MNCLLCGKELKGKQTKFCSKSCCQRTVNSKHQDYACQKLRGKLRRKKLLELLGGSCSRCGYEKHESAIEFHHINPQTKKFNLDVRKCSNSTWKALVEEAKKCILLCANCHAIEHAD